MTLKGVTLAEKLRLAQEAGVSLPHYTNTDNPVDFPGVEAKMNKKLRQFEKESKLEIFGLGAKRIPWEAALEKFAELIVKETMQVVANNLPQNTYLDVADAVIKHFGVEE
jgi:hypothetical protein